MRQIAGERREVGAHLADRASSTASSLATRKRQMPGQRDQIAPVIGLAIAR